MIAEFDIPSVFDDHEYWPLQARLLKEIATRPETIQSVFDLPKNIRRKFINNYATKLWTKWESEVVSSHPTITVSSKIAETMMTTVDNTAKIYVVPNFPLRTEVNNLSVLPHARLSCAYAGGDARNKEKYQILIEMDFLNCLAITI